jgi:hypothetical protein
MTITEFERSQPPVMTVNGGATVTLAECIFVDNIHAISNDTSQYFEFEEATISQPLDTIIRFQNCVFRDTSIPVSLVTDIASGEHPGGDVLVISDPFDQGVAVHHRFMEEDWEIDRDNWTVYYGVDAKTVPTARTGIDNTSAWFQEVQKVRFHFASHWCIKHGGSNAPSHRHSWYFAMFCIVRFHCESVVMSSVSFPLHMCCNMYRLVSLHSLPKE